MAAKLRNQIKVLLSLKNNKQIADALGCSYSYVDQTRRHYNIKHPKWKPHGLLKKQIKELLPVKNNKQIADALGCSYGYVDQTRRRYSIKNPHWKPFGLLTKKQFQEATWLYLVQRKGIGHINKKLGSPYKTGLGLQLLFKRKGVQQEKREESGGVSSLKSLTL